MAVLLHQLRRVPQHSPAQTRRIATTGSTRILGISGSIRQGSFNRKLLLAAKKVRSHAASAAQMYISVHVGYMSCKLTPVLIR